MPGIDPNQDRGQPFDNRGIGQRSGVNGDKTGRFGQVNGDLFGRFRITSYQHITVGLPVQVLEVAGGDILESRHHLDPLAQLCLGFLRR